MPPKRSAKTRERWISGWRFAALSISVMAIGCRDPGMAPTTRAGGTVRYHGQSVAEVTVIFTPAQGRPAVGVTDASGRFRLSTFRPGDGAVPGMHKVTLSSSRSGVDAMYGGRTPEAASPQSLPYPMKYAHPDQSDLTAEVKPGQANDFLLDLKD